MVLEVTVLLLHHQFKQSSVLISINGYFRLSYADAISMELQHDISASAMQVALITTHTPNANVEVTRKVVDGNFQWNVTFLSHLLEWSLKPLSVISGHDGDNSVSSLMEVGKVANNGLYPIQYTLWVKGIYELTIVTDGSSVSGSSYSFDVSDGVVHALTSLAYGNGLIFLSRESSYHSSFKRTTSTNQKSKQFMPLHKLLILFMKFKESKF